MLTFTFFGRPTFFPFSFSDDDARRPTRRDKTHVFRGTTKAAAAAAAAASRDCLALLFKSSMLSTGDASSDAYMVG